MTFVSSVLCIMISIKGCQIKSLPYMTTFKEEMLSWINCRLMESGSVASMDRLLLKTEREVMKGEQRSRSSNCLEVMKLLMEREVRGVARR